MTTIVWQSKSRKASANQKAQRNEPASNRHQRRNSKSQGQTPAANKGKRERTSLTEQARTGAFLPSPSSCRLFAFPTRLASGLTHCQDFCRRSRDSLVPILKREGNKQKDRQKDTQQEKTMYQRQTRVTRTKLPVSRPSKNATPSGRAHREARGILTHTQ